MVILFLTELQLGQALEPSNKAIIPLDTGKQWAGKYSHIVVFIVLQSVK
jgi:hypothetical protein